MELTIVRETHGFQLIKTGEEIVAINNFMGKREFQVRLGQIVVLNGRYLRKGLRARVIRILEPHTEGRTSDVIKVRLEGSGLPFYLKMDDVFFPICGCEYCETMKN